MLVVVGAGAGVVGVGKLCAVCGGCTLAAGTSCSSCMYASVVYHSVYSGIPVLDVQGEYAYVLL